LTFRYFEVLVLRDKIIGGVGNKKTIEMLSILANLENLYAKVYISRVSKFQPKIVYYNELKKHKLWFDEICSELLDQRKQAKFQWLQDPSEISGDNLNNIRRGANRHFRTRKRE
jgi:hypothetical protein